MRHAILFALLATTACQTQRTLLEDADYPGTLQPPGALSDQLVWQQQVTAAWREGEGRELRERSFTAAVQRQGDKLTVVGLSPMGEVGFSIEQTADGITVQNNMADQLQIPPRFILLDVQRVFFPWLGEPLASGQRIGRRNGEEIAETFANGRIVGRRFSRLDGKPAGEIVITYEWSNPDWRAPTRAVLDNNWFGYQLTIDTHVEQQL